MKSKDATALELYNRPKTEIKYIIEGVMPAVGYHILAGPEKDGKSTFATQFALAIAAGNKLMGHFKTTKSKVLFLSYEEDDVLSEDRIKFICQDTEPSPGVDYKFEFPSLDEGGLDWLEVYLEKNTDTKVVVIDTFAKFCGDRINRIHGNSTEGQIVRKIHKMTKIYGVAIVVIHHTVKNLTGTLRDVRGNGVNTQTADNILMLTSDKSRGIAKLRRIGRYGDADYALKYNKNRHCWDYLGEFDDTVLTQERQDILEVLIDAHGPVQVKEIAKEVKKSISATSNLLKRLRNQGLVQKPSFRVYEITEQGCKSLTTRL